MSSLNDSEINLHQVVSNDTDFDAKNCFPLENQYSDTFNYNNIDRVSIDTNNENIMGSPISTNTTKYPMSHDKIDDVVTDCASIEIRNDNILSSPIPIKCQNFCDVRFYDELYITSCKQIFNKSEILNWLKDNNTCPICKKQILIQCTIINIDDTNSSNLISKRNIGLYELTHILTLLISMCFIAGLSYLYISARMDIGFYIVMVCIFVLIFLLTISHYYCNGSREKFQSIFMFHVLFFFYLLMNILVICVFVYGIINNDLNGIIGGAFWFVVFNFCICFCCCVKYR